MTVQVVSNRVIKLKVASGFPTGNGIPAGGTTGQVLVKNSNTSYDTEWSSVVAGSATWGSINGDIDDQADLIALIDAAGRVYVQDTTPPTDSDDGDLWFNPTTETLQVKSSGTWVNHGHDDGFF